MPEPLKNKFGPEIPRAIAAMIQGVSKKFKADAFINDALDSYEELEFMPRAWKIAEALQQHLPNDYEQAIKILIASLGPKLDKTDSFGMTPFLYLPHVFYVAKYGLNHFEASMQAQYELTQRFTAEFSIRPYLEQHRDATLARLKEWAHDDSAHVRRLVSEGTRPRLPWAPRLREFQRDPRPVLELLELLKDDSDLYVRRSVANNLNDIGKDHPALLVETVKRWQQDATKERTWLIRHALRSAVKRADPAVLELMGYAGKANFAIDNVSISPKRVKIGESVAIAFELTNAAKRKQRLLVDLCVHFVKANGKAVAKVFKLKEIEFAAGETLQFKKTVSCAEMTTRKHYAGEHLVDVVVNGRGFQLGAFFLLA